MKDCKGILAHGESGHTHRVVPKSKVRIAVMERDDGVRVFSGEVDVVHEEHKTITLPARRWNSDKVLEYDYLQEMERQVMD